LADLVNVVNNDYSKIQLKAEKIIKNGCCLSIQ